MLLGCVQARTTAEIMAAVEGHRRAALEDGEEPSGGGGSGAGDVVVKTESSAAPEPKRVGALVAGQRVFGSTKVG